MAAQVHKALFGFALHSCTTLWRAIDDGFRAGHQAGQRTGHLPLDFLRHGHGTPVPRTKWATKHRISRRQHELKALPFCYHSEARMWKCTTASWSTKSTGWAGMPMGHPWDGVQSMQPACARCLQPRGTGCCASGMSVCQARGCGRFMGASCFAPVQELGSGGSSMYNTAAGR